MQGNTFPHPLQGGSLRLRFDQYRIKPKHIGEKWQHFSLSKTRSNLLIWSVFVRSAEFRGGECASVEQTGNTQVGNVIIGRQNHQSDDESKSDPEAHMLDLLVERLPANGFDRIIENMTAIEERDRHEIQNSDRNRQERSQVEQSGEAELGHLTCDLCDANGAGQLIGDSRPVTNPPKNAPVCSTMNHVS